MVIDQQYSRIDTLEIKAFFYKKVGHQRANRYFSLLSRFLNLKLSKNEFDKFCIRIIGRENIILHNQLIRSILNNCCLAKVPPQKVRKDDKSFNSKVANGYQRNCLQSVYSEAFPPSPRKKRSQVSQDRKFLDRPSPLGPLGKTPSVVTHEVVQRAHEQNSATELHSLGSRPPVEAASVEDGEEVEQIAGSPSIQSRSPVTAPLGISMNLGGSRKALYNGSICNFRSETCQNRGELPDTRSLRNRLDQKLEAEGLRITVDGANLLNNGLDVFLKRLIEPCIGLARMRSGKEFIKHDLGQNASGLLSGSNGRCMQRPPKPVCASVLDFHVAMESNPRVLGEDWPVQLEKICTRALGE